MPRGKKIIRVSARNTVSLGELAQFDQYEGAVDDQGRIILTPVRIVPLKEVRDGIRQ